MEPFPRNNPNPLLHQRTVLSGVTNAGTPLDKTRGSLRMNASGVLKPIETDRNIPRRRDLMERYGGAFPRQMYN